MLESCTLSSAIFVIHLTVVASRWKWHKLQREGEHKWAFWWLNGQWECGRVRICKRMCVESHLFLHFSGKVCLYFKKWDALLFETNTELCLNNIWCVILYKTL
jgi:hypothetical protein